MKFNPSIYEINTRVWLKRFDQGLIKASLNDIPNSYWNGLVEKGIDYIWLMGIWKISDSIIEKYCFENDLVKNYRRALKDWKKEDVIGSPFAVRDYEINPALGDKRSLLELKSVLNKKGIKLILDFVPNHFSAENDLLKSDPEIFLSVDKKYYETDPHTFYKPFVNEEKYFAHGRDPFFPAWQDTVQVNFFSQYAREYLTKILFELIKVCDGIRCDMAMLALNNVFQNTWGGVLSNNGHEKPATEFWTSAIAEIKNERPDFLFIAEAYWDLEWDLQQMGFDYTYDKKLTDRLKSARPSEIKEHLYADIHFQNKLMRFIENHDEERALTVFGKEKSKAAAVISSTIPGLRFYNDGQFEGKKIRLPVQLGREPEELLNENVYEFYNKLLRITSEEIFRQGQWELFEPVNSWGSNTTFKNILAWQWSRQNEKRIIAVNYSESTSTCRLKLDVRGFQEEFVMRDLLNDQTYTRSAEEIYHSGLFIELKPYQSHIFAF
ncbi:MAG: alpha-amylase family glycosyl hydrolase [Melioribacteraceae bacterium]